MIEIISFNCKISSLFENLIPSYPENSLFNSRNIQKKRDNKNKKFLNTNQIKETIQR